MKKMVVIMSHSLTEEQRVDARENLGITEFIELSTELKKLWSNIPPELDMVGTRDYLEPIIDWCFYLRKKEEPSELVFLVHGQPGAQTIVVNIMSDYIGLCYYATTKRVSIETAKPDGTVEKSSTFKHVRFVQYHVL